MVDSVDGSIEKNLHGEIKIEIIGVGGDLSLCDSASHTPVSRPGYAR